MSQLPDQGAVLKHPPLLATIFMGLLYLAGNLSNAIYPVFVTSVIAGGYATTANVGVLATAEFLSFGLAIALAGKFLPVRHLRLTAALCLTVQLIASYVTTKLSFGALIPCRALFGVAGGILVWMAYAYIARASHAGRLVATYTTALMIIGVIWSWVAPHFILPLFGHAGVIMLMTAPCLFALILVPACPDALPPLNEAVDADGQAHSGKIPAASMLVLMSIGCWSFFMTIFWVYAEPLSTQYRGEFISYWLTVSLICQIVGAALSAVLADRIPYRLCLSVGLLISVTQLVSIIAGVSGTGFVIWNGVSGFLGYFLCPFFVGALIDLDPSRRSVVFFPAAQNLAGSIGPLVVSRFVSETDLSAGLRIDLAAIVISPMLLWVGLIVHRRRASREAKLLPASRL